MEEQPLNIVCMTCHEGSWIKEIKMSEKKCILTLHCDKCMKDESFEITEYLSKFKELPKLDPFKHESQMLSEENFSEIKERIQKAKGLIKDCQEYKEKIKSSFHEFADLEANNCDEFINSNTIWTNLLEQLVATYEKNKLDAKLGYNLKQLSNLNEIKAPELVPKEGLVAALKKVEEFDKAIHQSFLIKPEYDSTKTPTFIKGNENYINIKALQRIEETPENTAFDGRFCIEDSNVWYYGGQDRKLKDGKLILASKSNRYSVAIYDPIQKCIVAKSENCNRDFLYIKEVSNGDIFTITEEYENKNILRIFRQKGAELTLVKQMLFKDVYNFQFKDSKDYMYAIKDNFYGEASGFIQLWSLDTQNDYKDMKMMAEYKTKNRTLYFLMCNDEKLIGIGRYNWYMLDPDTLKIIFEKKTGNTEVEGCETLYKLDDKHCIIGTRYNNWIIWVQGEEILYKSATKEHSISFKKAIRVEENGENIFLVTGGDHLAEVQFDPVNHDLKIKAVIQVAEGYQMYDKEDREYWNAPFDVDIFVLIRDKRILYFISSRDEDRRRIFKY